MAAEAALLRAGALSFGVGGAAQRPTTSGRAAGLPRRAPSLFPDVGIAGLRPPRSPCPSFGRPQFPCSPSLPTASGRQLRLPQATNSVAADETWLQKLPDKSAKLYSHSLPSIEAWLRSLGFKQDYEELTVWKIERPDWHAELSIEFTELLIRYLKSGPGKLQRDVERKFSYALSREDLQNAILGGP
eukprot:SM001712S03266  [mRNA]  locus=s1712:718:1994:- [translate_table: standard]